MDLLKRALDFVLHLDRHLGEIVAEWGPWIYALLFVIIFCETGLVVTPVLPGDSLLFAVGALCGAGAMNLALVLLLLTVGAIAGDTVNYWIGHFFGPKAFSGRYKLLNPKHLEKTHNFYERYGGKTIIIARFVPIVRTFAPFVAGACTMTYGRFMSYNVVGGIVWVFSITLLGYFFGNLPIVKKNFGLVVIAIIVISILPAVVEFFRERAKRSKQP
jgi:membrane-associated protein